MKCINKLKWCIPAFFLCFILSGCTEREDLPSAYDLYDTSDSYELSESVVRKQVSLFAEDLCVGGTENTVSDAVNPEYAETAAVFCVDDEQITYAQNIYEKRYPASTTKILTAYIALKYGNTDDVITVSSEAVDTLMQGSSICGLRSGDQLTLDEALYGLMLCSGNDAANAIAEYISGSTDAFAELMNQEAQALGATHSNFVNAHGLPDENHYTTAYDMYLIFNAAIKDERFVNYISTKTHETSYTNASGETVNETWLNTNGYLKGTYDEPENITVVGGKTGTTDAAGSCLVLLSRNEENKDVISIVMKGNSKDHLYTMMTEMLSNFSN